MKKELPQRSEMVALLKHCLGTDKAELTEPRDSDFRTMIAAGRLISRRELAHHWGLVELRAFLDALYDGPPESEDEKL